MADWKNNKVLGIIAGVVGIILILGAISSVMKRTSVSRPRGEFPPRATDHE